MLRFDRKQNSVNQLSFEKKIVMRVEKLKMDTIINFKSREALKINLTQDVKKVKGLLTICTSQTLNIFFNFFIEG